MEFFSRVLQSRQGIFSAIFLVLMILLMQPNALNAAPLTPAQQQIYNSLPESQRASYLATFDVSQRNINENGLTPGQLLEVRDGVSPGTYTRASSPSTAPSAVPPGSFSSASLQSNADAQANSTNPNAAAEALLRSNADAQANSLNPNATDEAARRASADAQANSVAPQSQQQAGQQSGQQSGQAVSSSAGSGGKYQNLEKIPGSGSGTTSSFTEYLKMIYEFGIAVVAILAVVMIAVGGFAYIVTSAGNASKVMDAKDMIMNAILGLVVALIAWLILYTINPDLISGTLTGTSGGTGGGGGQQAQAPGSSGQTPTLARGCTDKVDQEINKAAAAKGFDPNIMKAIVRGGEGCNPNISKDGHESCGYSQVIAKNRPSCGMKDTSCSYVMSSEGLSDDINCGATIIQRCIQQSRSSQIRDVASCYNAGAAGRCARTTNDYCGRVEAVFGKL